MRSERWLFVVFISLMTAIFVMIFAKPAPSPPIQSEGNTFSQAPPSEEAILRAKMCNTIREAVREYATHVPALSVSISNRDTAIHVMYMLCMIQPPR